MGTKCVPAVDYNLEERDYEEIFNSDSDLSYKSIKIIDHEVQRLNTNKLEIKTIQLVHK
jgi:hypothetical protein